MEEINDPLVLKTINEILDKQFFIPHFQRGYRWTNQQVTQLLNDIDAFNPKEIPGKQNEKTFYCLQPVVVKLLNDDIKRLENLEGEWYEVIDGQQRLTTIFLIIHYINEMWLGKQKKAQFKLNYETRENCETFLSNIKVNDDNCTVNIDKSNIDYFHISTAYQTIRNWELNYKDEKGKALDEANFQSKILAASKIIWYQVDNSEKSQALFERLNLGKIPLTNSELTKALFLSSNSFLNLSSEEQKIKKIEIARLWDEMEHKLNEPDLKFWSFITNDKKEDYDTKIDLILNMISEKKKDEKDPLFTFIKFTDKQKKGNLSDIWLEIEQFYLTLLEWYSDKNYYHKIGYLIAAKNVIKDNNFSLAFMVKQSMEKPKEEFMTMVDESIKTTIKYEFSELRYKDHPHLIFNILLLLNVETNRTSDAISEYYPFKQHKSNVWSLEHIHARNSENFDKSKKDQWRSWLDLHLPVLREFQTKNEANFDVANVQAVILEIEKYNNPQLTWERFSDLFIKVNNIFTLDSQSMDRDSEGLSNLALLSQPDNAALNNAVFEIKRREIIKLDKSGSFIPVCTRRAFMKYYNDEGINTQYFYWSPDDRSEYLTNIKKILKPYITNNYIDKEENEND